MRANKAGWGDREMGGSAAPLIRWHSEAWMKWGRELRRHQSTGGLWIITAECGGLTEIIFKRKTWHDRGNTENILSSFQYFLVYILCERQMAASEEPLKQSRFLLLGVLLWVGEQKREEDTEMHMHMCVCARVCTTHTHRKLSKMDGHSLVQSHVTDTAIASNRKGILADFQKSVHILINKGWVWAL